MKISTPTPLRGLGDYSIHQFFGWANPLNIMNHPEKYGVLYRLASKNVGCVQSVCGIIQPH